MKCVVFGNRELGCACLEELLDLGARVPLVVTYPPDPNEAPGFRSLAETAAGLGLVTVTPPDASGRPLLDWIRALRPDAVFSFYYGHRIPRTIRRVPRLGAYNLHGALLPRWRGRAPLPWVILEGEEVAGATLHHMVDEMDAGDVVAQASFRVDPRETATTLYRKMVAAARMVLREAVPAIAEGRAPRTPQDHSVATVAPALLPRRPVDRSFSVERFDRTVRAFARPYPGALAPMGDGDAVIWEGEPGEDGPGIAIPLADGVYRVLRLGRPGGPDEDAAAFLERHPGAADLLGVPRPRR